MRYFCDASHIILATERERDKMRMRYDGSNMHVVHWPVETLDNSKKQDARASLRKRLGLRENAQVLLYFGLYHLLMVGFDGDVCREKLKHVANEIKQVHVMGPARGSDREEVLLGAG